MRQILTVKELITLLLDYNMDAYTYVNANGLPIGISLPNICFGGGKEGETKKDCKEVNAKGILGIMSLGVKQGQEITVKVSGDKEDEAAAELEAFLKANL